MKFLILDPYTNDNWRLVKDTAGGYGTGNDFGNSIFSKLINFFVSKMISMPPMYAIYIYSILIKRKCKVEYTRSIKKINLDDFDYIIMTSSIICHETEIKILEEVLNKGKKVFVAGVFANTLKEKYSLKNSYVVPGEPEFFFLNLELQHSSIENYFKKDTEKYKFNRSCA